MIATLNEENYGIYCFNGYYTFELYYLIYFIFYIFLRLFTCNSVFATLNYSLHLACYQVSIRLCVVVCMISNFQVTVCEGCGLERNHKICAYGT